MSSSLLRAVCKSCSILQRQCRVKPNRVQWYQSYNRQLFLVRCYVTSTRIPESSKAIAPEESSRQCEALTEETHDVESRDIWENLEHDVVDVTTFDLVKRHYLERIQEIENSDKDDHANKSIAPKKDAITNGVVRKKKKRSTRHPSPAKYVRGNQLTYQSEQNVLAEIDIYAFLGNVTKAVNLFNFHRRHGHKFNVDAYNKMIHLWASQSNWKSIQMLLKNMMKEGLEPNHQTYAGLLEACGNMMDASKVENVLMEMELKDISVDDIFRKAVLTKQQIESIVDGVAMLRPKLFEDFEECKNGARISTTITKTSFEDAINKTSLVKQQIESELTGTIKVKSIDVSKVNDKTSKKRAQQYQTVIEQWKKNFIKELIIARNTKATRDFLYNRCITYSCVLTPEEITDILFDDILPIICTQPQGIPVNFVCRRLGHLIYSKFAAKFKAEKGVSEKVERIMSEYSTCDEWLDRSIHPRDKWKQISSELSYLASEEVLPNTWPTKLRAMTSSVLLDILKKVAIIDTKMFLKSDITKVESALSHHYEFVGNYRIGVLKFHPVVGKLYGSYLSQIGDLSFEANKMPMLIPPRPWISSTSGAYLLLHSDLVRTITGQYKLNQLRSASDQGNLNKIYDSLNYLGNTAWRINERILDVMIELFNNDGDMKLDIIGPNLPEIEKWKEKRSMTYEERQSRQRTRKLYHELFALRMDLLYKLSIANHFRGQVFWIPSNLDFRGRVYPIAPHCSHIGSDVSRGLLIFAEGKKLGKKGIDWLKVHLVNLHGQLKKSSLNERIKYADDHLEEIFDSADQPLTGNKWWQGASDPWQTLVACMELTNALRSGDPENYVSHMPIQQDGSCNGLQHYASLGRDEYGAIQVNCMPADRPQDVYLEVANLVEKKRSLDAANGVQIAQQLEGKINRKVVKQTVMTVVYGVTFVGGRLQIEKQLKELDVENAIIFKASVYVVQEVFKSLTEMFTSARQIQDWLTHSAAQIALTGNCVDWVTPLGLPIIQPYHKQTTEAISTPLQIVASTHSFDYTQIPHLTKQKGGFPPNFVHSLDSTHMMLTSLRCQEDRMTFASVHDSYWTHALDVEKMNKFCREEFVALHKLPILDELKKHFDESYAGLKLRKTLKDGSTEAKFEELPEKGTFDINKVLESVYFFS